MFSTMETYTSGNKFGRGITFHEGAPIQLLSYEEGIENGTFGQITLNPNALSILQTINEPLSIISVVGSYRRGKSWFANALHGRHDGFELGAKVQGCTRGIYMWSPPFMLESKRSGGKTIQKRVVVLDSEGMDDPKQDQNWAIKLFILCLAISSTFIYNINGIVGRDDIGKLYLMTDLSKFIQEPEEGDFLPRLAILLRDFTLERPDSFKDYFLEKLEDVNAEAAVAISQFFSDFDVYGLPPPGCKVKMLQHMEDADTDELDEDFVDEVEYAVKAIYSNLPLKYIGSSTMKGVAFVKFLQVIVERMNSSETSSLLSIPSEYESVIQFVAQVALKEAKELYEERMGNLMNHGENFPILWEEFEEIHNNCISEANKLFYDKVIGSPEQMEDFIGQLHEKISKFKEEFVKKNSEKLMDYNENLAKEFWEKYVKIGLTQETLFESTDKFQDALNKFESACNSSMMASPEAANVVASYMQNQYPAAIDCMTQLGKMNAELAKAMHAKEEAVKLQLQSLAREEEFRRELEAQKREYEVNEKNFRAKMEELQTNIKAQQRSHEEMKQRFAEDRERTIAKYNKKFEEMQNSMLEQQRKNDESKMKLIEEQQRKFQEMQKSIEEENRRANEELRIKFTQEKDNALEQQNRFFKEQMVVTDKANKDVLSLLKEQIEAKSREVATILEKMEQQQKDDAQNQFFQEQMAANNKAKEDALNLLKEQMETVRVDALEQQNRYLKEQIEAVSRETEARLQSMSTQMERKEESVKVVATCSGHGHCYCHCCYVPC